MTAAHHQSKSQEWGTPMDVIEAADAVLGGIDLDPASSHEFNTRVQARLYYTAADNGLALPWYGHVFLNPPGGKDGNRSVATLWWRKLVCEVREGRASHAIYVAFNINQLQVAQAEDELCLLDFPFCVPRQRLRFVDGRASSSPAHANAIVYVPGSVNETRVFEGRFSELGKVVVPRELARLG